MAREMASAGNEDKSPGLVRRRQCRPCRYHRLEVALRQSRRRTLAVRRQGRPQMMGTLLRGCRTASFYRNFQDELCARQMPLNAQLSMHLIDQSLDQPHSKTISLRDVKVGGQSRSLIAD